MRSVVGRWSVGPQYILLLTLISYTPFRYVRKKIRTTNAFSLSSAKLQGESTIVTNDLVDHRQPEMAAWPPKPEKLISPKLW